MRNNDVPPCVQLEYLKRIDQKKKKSMCVCVFEKIMAEKNCIFVKKYKLPGSKINTKKNIYQSTPNQVAEN